jgi:hypothetical protein
MQIKQVGNMAVLLYAFAKIAVLSAKMPICLTTVLLQAVQL